MHITAFDLEWCDSAIASFEQSQLPTHLAEVREG